MMHHLTNVFYINGQAMASSQHTLPFADACELAGIAEDKACVLAMAQRGRLVAAAIAPGASVRLTPGLIVWVMPKLEGEPDAA